MKPVITLLVSAIAFAASSTPVQANLIVNGSFENPAIAPNSFITPVSIPGWTGSPVLEIQSNSVLGAGNVAQDGVQYAELNPFTPSALSQDISGLQVGGQYLLTFYYSARPGTGANTAMATFEGNAAIPLAAGPVNQITWMQFSQLVTITDSTSTLTFQGLTPDGSVGNLIDNVSLVQVSAIPEPATLAVFGLMAVGAFGARRRLKAAA
jgi:hypothetical protein